MPATLRSIEATIDSNGLVHLQEPLRGPAKAVVTVLIDDPVPNAETQAAMSESIESLPSFDSVEALMEDLEN
ncbi:MAG: hypothetical protein ACI8UO_004512 [Verrucomicrobiales bacterium]|jgi:hypothetical protein